MNLPGADELYVSQFQALLAQNDVAAAAKLAAESPNGVLRSAETIQKFQQVPQQAGQPPPVFQYFSILLDKGRLNQLEGNIRQVEQSMAKQVGKGIVAERAAWIIFAAVVSAVAKFL